MAKNRAGDKWNDLDGAEKHPQRKEYYAHAFEQMQSDSDRTAAIVGASFVEEMLEESLITMFRPNGDADTLARMFNPEGALGTFSSKIDLCFVLGVYGPKTHANLKRIKDIRNKFAHKVIMLDSKRSMAPVSFATQQIAAWCGAITEFGDAPFDKEDSPKYRYIMACMALVLHLQHDTAARRFGEKWKRDPAIAQQE